MKRLGAALLWATAGALALFLLLPAPPPEPVPYIITHTEVLEAREPDTVVRWRERIIYRTPEPDQVVTAPGGGSDELAAFCAEAMARAIDASQPEFAHPIPRPSPMVPGPGRLLLRSVRFQEGFLFRPDRLYLTGPTSGGDLRETAFTTRRNWTARTVGDSILLRRPRWDVLVDLGEMALPLAAGFFLGRLF